MAQDPVATVSADIIALLDEAAAIVAGEQGE
jgi:hypothetical protein